MESIRHSGFLYKRGPTKKHAYKLRWVVLDGNYLRYYKSEKDNKEQGMFTMHKVINLWVNGGGNDPPKPHLEGLVFVLDVMQDSGIPREFCFCAMNPDSKTTWCNVLQQSISFYRTEKGTSDVSRPTQVQKQLHIDHNMTADEIVSAVTGQPVVSASPVPSRFNNSPSPGVRSQTLSNPTPNQPSPSLNRVLPPVVDNRSRAASTLPATSPRVLPHSPAPPRRNTDNTPPQPSAGTRPLPAPQVAGSGTNPPGAATVASGGVIAPGHRPPPPNRSALTPTASPAVGHRPAPSVVPSPPAQKSGSFSSPSPQRPLPGVAGKPPVAPSGSASSSSRPLPPPRKGGGGSYAPVGPSPNTSGAWDAEEVLREVEEEMPTEQMEVPVFVAPVRPIPVATRALPTPSPTVGRKLPTPVPKSSLTSSGRELPTIVTKPAPVAPPVYVAPPVQQYEEEGFDAAYAAEEEEAAAILAGVEEEVDMDNAATGDSDPAEQRVAVWDFDPEDVDQIELKAGDKFAVEQIDGEWVLGTNLNSGLHGWVPLVYTAPI